MIGSPRHTNFGFTLIELAMVLMIVALLLGGLLPTITSQVEQRNVGETIKQLDEIQQALIGYAIINGRLPCPASSTSNGVESPTGGGNCTNFYNGFVPAATLGLSGTSSSGQILDSWGNPIRYAVTQWNNSSPAVNNVFTTTLGMSTVGISNLSPNLLVCSTASTSSSSCSVANSSLTSTPGVPAVIFSTGKTTGTGTDEGDNTDNDRVFVSHTPTSTFDDLVIWISPNILLNRMVTAGKLP
jgi:prepilin-type N-terminal cleavage/methylation domain-containing protein